MFHPYHIPYLYTLKMKWRLLAEQKLEKGLADLTKFRFVEIFVVVQEIVQKGFKRGEYVKNLQGE